MNEARTFEEWSSELERQLSDLVYYHLGGHKARQPGMARAQTGDQEPVNPSSAAGSGQPRP